MKDSDLNIILAAIFKNRQLQILSLKNNYLTDEIFTLLERIIEQCKDLKEINLSDN